jgi:hypothetical protein
VHRRFLLTLLRFALVGSIIASARAADQRPGARGSLTVTARGKPALRTAAGKLIPLATADQETLDVLADPRLAGTDFEVAGHPGPGGAFTVDPIYKRALFVHKDGKKLLVTYWCDICYIRSYSPGNCRCCQNPTRPDFVDPETFNP